MTDEDAVNLAGKVGEVVGAIGGVGKQLESVDGRLQNVEKTLSDGAGRMTSLEDGQTAINLRLDGILEQQKIANGRTGKIEKAAERLARRVGFLEQWRRTVNFLPRAIDKLGEHKVLGLFLTVPLTSALTIVALKLFT